MAKSILISQFKSGLFVKVLERFKYEGKQATSEMENIIVILLTQAGEIQILFPAEMGRKEKFEKEFSFGEIIELEQIADVQDTKISIYNDALSVKIFANYLED